MVDLATLRVLSLHQPWASLMVWGLKLFETRSWPTKYRGQLIVHAAKAHPYEYSDLYHDPYFEQAFEVIGNMNELPRGCVLGVVAVIDCHPALEVKDKIGASERAFGLYDDGSVLRYAWQTDPEYTRRFKTPVPARGYQRLFSPTLWPKETYDHVAAQLAEVSRA